MKFDSREVLLIGLMAGAIGVSVWVLFARISEQPATNTPTTPEPVAVVEESGAVAVFATHPGQREFHDSVHPASATPNAAIRAQKARDAKTAGLGQSSGAAVERPHRRVIIQTFPAAPMPGQPASADGSAPSELQIDLAPGVREPLALTAAASDFSPQQIPALEGIANDFADRIEQAAEFYSEEEFAATWDVEQANADAQFYALFGAEAYNRKMAAVAAEAVPGKPVEREAAPK